MDDEANFFWLIRISMSQNLPESNYSAMGTAEVPLKSMLKIAKMAFSENVF